MEKRKNKKKKIILIIIILSILIVSVVVSIILKNNKRSRMLGPGKYQQAPADNDPKEDGQFNISGFGVFYSKFTGVMNGTDVVDELKQFATKRLPRTYDYIKDYDEDDLKIFYQNNQNSIFNMYGIDNIDDFLHFAKAIQVGREDLNDCYRSDLLQDTFVDESTKEGYAYAEFVTKYKDDTEIRFSIYVAKSNDITPQFIINAK